MKRIEFSGSWILLALLFALGPGKVQGQSVTDLTTKLEQLNAYPDLIVVNGKIATMDGQLTQVQAIAVKNGRILARGNNNEIRFLAGPKTEILDAKGRTILPGLIDGHAHPHRRGIEHWLGAEGDFTSKKYNDPQLKMVLAKGNDQVEVLRSMELVVRKRAEELGPGKWILVKLFGKNTIPESREIVWPLVRGRGQSIGGKASGTVTTELLDTLAPENPLVIYGSEAIGGSVANTRAKELTKKLLGVETSDITPIVYDILLRGRTEEKLDFLKRELSECLAAQGITTYGNTYYGGLPSIMQLQTQLYRRSELPVRWAWWIDKGASEDKLSENPSVAAHYPELFYNDLGDFRGIGNDYIWHAGIGHERFDNGLLCTTAKPVNPLSRAGGVGILGLDGPRPDCSTANIVYEKDKDYMTVRAALEAGLRIGFLHHYSDGTFDALFHMLEQAMAEGKLSLAEVRALRVTTEHTPIIRPDQVAKIAKYGIVPSFSAYMLQGHIKGGAFLKSYGEKYMTWLQPLKSLVDAGAHPVFGSDAHLGKVPVEWKDMDYPSEWDGNIWGFIEFFITRRMPSDGVIYNRNEAMDRTSAMKAVTIWGAEQLLNEQNVGSLEVGKLADFIVIDKDYFTIPENEIGTIKTLLTVLGGKSVYRASAY